MLDQVTWDRYCATELIGAADVHAPIHTAAIDLEVVHRDACTEIFATVVNTTPTVANQLFDGTNPYDPKAIDLRLYEVTLTAETDAPCLPYELDQVAKSYRYDRTVAAFGISCPVHAETNHGTTTLTTSFAAGQETKRVHPRIELHLPGQNPVALDTSFRALIADPVAALDALASAHLAWVEHHWSITELDRLGNQLRLGRRRPRRSRRGRPGGPCRRSTGSRPASNCSAPTRTYGTRSCSRTGRWPPSPPKAPHAYDAWHPFQVAWIVGCLPGMVDPAAASARSPSSGSPPAAASPRRTSA